MAQGDFTLFEEVLNALDDIDWDADTFKVSLVKDSGSDPLAADPLPAYSGGTTNWNGALDEASDAGTYTNGGTAIGTPTFTEVGGVATFNDDGSNLSWAQDASNDTAVRWAILYDDTTTPKHAIGFYDLGSAFDMTTGDLSITFSSNGLLQFSIQTSVAYSA
jgi:hypothetical protein